LKPLDLALAVAAAFDRSGVPCFLGGSLASSLQGEPRATNDIDFMIEIDEERIARPSAELGTDFDVDETALASGGNCLRNTSRRSRREGALNLPIPGVPLGLRAEPYSAASARAGSTRAAFREGT
jgi:hypothetical protein